MNMMTAKHIPKNMKTIIRTNGLKEHRNDKTELKTIKELESTSKKFFLQWEEGVIFERKRVLGLINEMRKKGMLCINKDYEELIKGITG